MLGTWRSKLTSLGSDAVRTRPKPAVKTPEVTARTSNVVVPTLIQTWVGGDIAVEIQSKNIANAHRAWMSITSKRLPRMSDIVNSEAKPALGEMMLLMKKDNDFLVVAQSSNYIRDIGRDLRGSLMSEFNIPTAEPMKEIYNKVLEQRQPIYARYVSEFSQNNVYWEVLIVPLAADDSGMPMFALNFVALIDDKSAILQMVFDRSPIGMIVAAPTQTDRGQFDDGRIISVNARAKSILRLTENQRQVQTIRQLAPWFRDGTAWTKIGMTIDGARTQIYYRDDSDKNFAMTIEAFSRFVLFSIVEVDKYEIQKLSKPR